MRLTFVLFSMSQVRSAKRVCKERGRKAYYLTKSRNDLPTREWLYRDGAARKVLGECDFVFDDDLNRDNLLKIAVTADELREVNVYEACVQPLDGDEFTVHVDVAASVGEVSGSEQSGSRQDPELSYEKQNDCEDRQILRPRIVYAYRVLCTLPR